MWSWSRLTLSGMVYRAVSLSKYDWKNASCASLGVWAPWGGSANTITLHWMGVGTLKEVPVSISYFMKVLKP